MIKKSTLLIVLLFTINSFSQKNNISPYSFFGVGEINETQSVSEQNMGSIGGAQNSTYMLHFTNPASYGHLRLTTYAISGKNKYLTVFDADENQSSSAFSVSYLALGFPLSKKAGFVVGLQPNSKVGYTLSNELTNGQTGTNLFFGKGGTNKVFLGLGYKLPYNFSIGLEGSYVFGNVERRILNRRDNVYLATMHQTDSDISGYSLKAGIQNSFNITKKLTVKTGLSLNLENDLNVTGNEKLYSLVNVVDPYLIIEKDVIRDTDYNSKINSPLKTTISAGIGHKNKWFAGAEYSFQDAIIFIDDVLQNNNVRYTKSSKMAFGGFYTPKAESLTNYWQRVTYRAGAYTKELGLTVNNVEIKDFGMSFGLTLPSKRKLSNINLGFDIGQKGENKNGSIKENYFNFRLSLSFTDKWFKKRKLN